MKKVPLIQEKAEDYHHEQAEKADEALQKELTQKQRTAVEEVPQDILQTKKERSTLGGQLWRRIVDKFS